jgi:hypothetical protein
MRPVNKERLRFVIARMRELRLHTKDVHTKIVIEGVLQFLDLILDSEGKSE